MKVTVEFNSIEDANIAVAAVNSGSIPAHIAAAPAPVAPAPVYPAPLPPQAPAPVGAPGQFIPPAAPAPVAAPVAAPATVAAPAGDSGGITAAQLGAAAQNYSKVYKAAATKQVFAHFGITKIGDAHPSIYPQLLQALTVQAA